MPPSETEHDDGTKSDLADAHVCTCGDCEIDSFIDRCKFEFAARRALRVLSKPDGEDEAKRILESVLA